MSCCGIWPFGRGGSKSYRRIPNTDLDSRMETDIKLGLPPGVTIGDLLKNAEDKTIMDQLYPLAVQANTIEEHVKRFTLCEVPEECKSVMKAQIDKLKAVQHVIWNTMISLAVGAVSIDETTLANILDKRAEESMALLEMEKIATAVKLDDTAVWATDIANIVSSQPTPTIESFPMNKKEAPCRQSTSMLYSE